MVATCADRVGYRALPNKGIRDAVLAKYDDRMTMDEAVRRCSEDPRCRAVDPSTRTLHTESTTGVVDTPGHCLYTKVSLDCPALVGYDVQLHTTLAAQQQQQQQPAVGGDQEEDDDALPLHGDSGTPEARCNTAGGGLVCDGFLLMSGQPSSSATVHRNVSATAPRTGDCLYRRRWDQVFEPEFTLLVRSNDLILPPSSGPPSLATDADVSEILPPPPTPTVDATADTSVANVANSLLQWNGVGVCRVAGPVSRTYPRPSTFPANAPFLVLGGAPGARLSASVGGAVVGKRYRFMVHVATVGDASATAQRVRLICGRDRIAPPVTTRATALRNGVRLYVDTIAGDADPLVAFIELSSGSPATTWVDDGGFLLVSAWWMYASRTTLDVPDCPVYPGYTRALLADTTGGDDPASTPRASRDAAQADCTADADCAAFTSDGWLRSVAAGGTLRSAAGRCVYIKDLAANGCPPVGDGYTARANVDAGVATTTDVQARPPSLAAARAECDAQPACTGFNTDNVLKVGPLDTTLVPAPNRCLYAKVNGCPPIMGYHSMPHRDAPSNDGGNDLDAQPLSSLDATRAACNASAGCAGFNSQRVRKRAVATTVAVPVTEPPTCLYVRKPLDCPAVPGYDVSYHTDDPDGGAAATSGNMAEELRAQCENAGHFACAGFVRAGGGGALRQRVQGARPAEGHCLYARRWDQLFAPDYTLVAQSPAVAPVAAEQPLTPAAEVLGMVPSATGCTLVPPASTSYAPLPASFHPDRPFVALRSGARLTLTTPDAVVGRRYRFLVQVAGRPGLSNTVGITARLGVGITAREEMVIDGGPGGRLLVETVAIQASMTAFVECVGTDADTDALLVAAWWLYASTATVALPLCAPVAGYTLVDLTDTPPAANLGAAPRTSLAAAVEECTATAACAGVTADGWLKSSAAARQPSFTTCLYVKDFGANGCPPAAGGDAASSYLAQANVDLRANADAPGGARSTMAQARDDCDAMPECTGFTTDNVLRVGAPSDIVSLPTGSNRCLYTKVNACPAVPGYHGMPNRDAPAASNMDDQPLASLQATRAACNVSAVCAAFTSRGVRKRSLGATVAVVPPTDPPTCLYVRKAVDCPPVAGYDTYFHTDRDGGDMRSLARPDDGPSVVEHARNQCNITTPNGLMLCAGFVGPTGTLKNSLDGAAPAEGRCLYARRWDQVFQPDFDLVSQSPAAPDASPALLAAPQLLATTDTVLGLQPGGGGACWLVHPASAVYPRPVSFPADRAFVALRGAGARLVLNVPNAVVGKRYRFLVHLAPWTTSNTATLRFRLGAGITTREEVLSVLPPSTVIGARLFVETVAVQTATTAFVEYAPNPSTDDSNGLLVAEWWLYASTATITLPQCATYPGYTSVNLTNSTSNLGTAARASVAAAIAECTATAGCAGVSSDGWLKSSVVNTNASFTTCLYVKDFASNDCPYAAPPGYTALRGRDHRAGHTGDVSARASFAQAQEDCENSPTCTGINTLNELKTAPLTDPVAAPNVCLYSKTNPCPTVVGFSSLPRRDVPHTTAAPRNLVDLTESTTVDEARRRCLDDSQCAGFNSKRQRKSTVTPTVAAADTCLYIRRMLTCPPVANYTVRQHTDQVGQTLTTTTATSSSTSIADLRTLCDNTPGCEGFNTAGQLKRVTQTPTPAEGVCLYSWVVPPNAVRVLGPVGMMPWRLSDRSFYTLANANFIWVREPTWGALEEFTFDTTVMIPADTMCVFHSNADNEWTVAVNGVRSATFWSRDWTRTYTIYIMLRAGPNRISVVARDLQVGTQDVTSSMVIAAVLSVPDNRVVTRTDKTWTYTKGATV